MRGSRWGIRCIFIARVLIENTAGVPAQPPLIAFVLRRLLQGILVMLVVGFIAFSLFNFVGDPVALMLPPEATHADREVMRKTLGLDQPFYVQFAHFLANAVHGNFGISLRLGRPVSTLIVERIPATLEHAFTRAILWSK